jgi:hypothetical protein
MRTLSGKRGAREAIRAFNSFLEAVRAPGGRRRGRSRFRGRRHNPSGIIEKAVKAPLLRNQRLLLEARALTDLGRHDLALEVAANLEGREAICLRSDILWAGSLV